MSNYDQFNSQRRIRHEQFIVKPTSITTAAAHQDLTNVTEGGYRCKVSRNGTGDISLTYNAPFKRAPVVSLTCLHASSKLFGVLVSSSTTVCRFAVFSDAGTATDPTEVHVTVRGADTSDAQG